MRLPELLQAAVYEGLGRMFLLRPEGCPASDELDAVTSIWVDVLSNMPVSWDEARDLHRIRGAFYAMEHSIDRWPTPFVFKRFLPPVRNLVSLPPPRSYGEPPPEWREMVERLRLKLEGKQISSTHATN